LQAPGVHEAPGFAALQYGADPTQPPMVPPNDLEGDTGGYMQYSKPAALVHSHERYMRELTGGEDIMRGLLQVRRPPPPPGTAIVCWVGGGGCLLAVRL
jgi:hypothetical protein